MSQINVLIAGETWFTHSTHVKGVDHFQISGYGEGIKWLREALEASGDIKVTHMPSHVAINEFPSTKEELEEYNIIFLSDIGANTLLLPDENVLRSKVTSNRLSTLRDFVESGGALCMIGGWMSFQGIDGRARYHNTPVEEALPVTLQPSDDRVEAPQSIQPIIVTSDHYLTTGLPEKWPPILGYNRLTTKPRAMTVVRCEDDPLVSVWSYGEGRAMAFSTDCAPHWAPPEFLNWEYYGEFWRRAAKWLARKT